MTWTAERVEELQTLWADGLSCSLIARKLGGMTRNAVIGKAHRLGLPTRPRSGGRARIEKRVNPYPPRVKRKVEKLRSACGKQGLVGQLLRPRPIEIAPCQPPLMLGLMELTDESCRFPIDHPGEPDFGFCGHEPKAGSAYCAGHHRVCYAGLPR
jgi:GcrA cell cycle regulator